MFALEPSPFVQLQFEPAVDEFFPPIDMAEKMTPHFLGSLHLAGDLVGPVVGNMAIRADRDHTAYVRRAASYHQRCCIG